MSIAGEMRIIEQFQLDRFNEIRLTAANERPRQFTQENAPDATLFPLFLERIAATQIVYDDGLNFQNELVSLLDGFENYNEATAPRMGDTVNNLTGVLDYKWAGNSASNATWRIRSHQEGSNTFVSANPRPAAPEDIDGTLKIASANVLNFFTTLDVSGALTAVGQDPRGADDLSPFTSLEPSAEFDRQLVKMVNGLAALDADIIGLIEIENDFDATNDGSTAIEVLVNAINAVVEDDYDYVFPGQQFVGTDAIAVGYNLSPKCG